MLNYEFPPLGGGAGNATKYILKEFAKHKDLKIDLVTSSISNFRIEKFSDNITIHYLDIGKNNELHNQSNKNLLVYSKKAYFYCKKLMKTTRYDLCHAFFGVPCGFIAQRLKLPYIISLRGADVPHNDPKRDNMHKLFYFVNKTTWKNAKFVIANSEDLREKALKTKFVQDVGIISNGVDCNKFKPSSIVKKNDKLNVLYVGRLNKIKNLHILIESIKKLDNVQLNIVGDGPEMNNLKKLVEKFKINKKVKFYGKKPHDELIKIFQENSVYVQPSLNEGMSNTVLEAMACGLPIISTNTGGVSKLIKDNGFIVETSNVQAIKDKLQELINNRILIENMGKKSRTIALEMSWDKVADEYKELYEK